MEVMLSGNIRARSSSQPRKACGSIEVTLSGSCTDRSALAALKAPAPIVAVPFRTRAEVMSESQPMRRFRQ